MSSNDRRNLPPLRRRSRDAAVSASGVTVIAGIEIPSTSAIFLTIVGLHIAVGLASVIAGAVAMLSPKAPGRHPTFGTIYYWCLAAVFVSATALAIMRWQEDYHLFLLGALAFSVASTGRAARRGLWHGWTTWHITGMGLSLHRAADGFLRRQRKEPAVLEGAAADLLLGDPGGARLAPHRPRPAAVPRSQFTRPP